MRIGIIGAGQVGKTLGRAWANAGHEIVYGVRERGTPSPHAGSATDSVRGAATAGEVVVLTTPWAAVPDALQAAGDLGGKPLLDVTNPMLTMGHTSSGAEEVQRLATNARVVKAFNSTGHENMANPAYGGRRVLMPVAGDDPSAVAAAVKLASDIGFEGIGLEGLARARELEPLGLLWIKLALQWGQGRSIAFGISRRAANERAPVRAPSPRRLRLVVIGAGNIGGALARAWLRAGHDVRIATRDGASKEVSDLVALGATAVPVPGAAQGVDVVVFAIPAGAVVDAARSLGSLDGKIVVDCTNAIAKGFTLQYGFATSSSEEIAKALPGARVVRAFNQQGAETLQNPSFGGLAATSFIAADDEDARHVVRELTADVGLDAVEAGPLSSARYLEPITLLWVAIAKAIGTREFGLSLLRCG